MHAIATGPLVVTGKRIAEAWGPCSGPLAVFCTDGFSFERHCL